MERQSILITGVYGLVGSCLYRHLAQQSDRYKVYGMDRHREGSARTCPEEVAEIPESHFIQANLSKRDVLEKAFQGMDTVVHLAGDPSPEASWESLLMNNIDGSRHVFEAAKQAGVRRVVFASSIHVSFGYFLNAEPYRSIREGRFEEVPEPFDRIGVTDPTWPVNLYGSSKVFGEALARMYSSEAGLSCLCVRLGGVHSKDRVPVPLVPNACTRNDASRLLECCIQAPDTLRFDIFYGLSNSDYRWVDIENARQAIGYVPEDRIPLTGAG